jgi:hypothetical protein
MNATKWVLILFIACLVWIPVSIHLGEIAAQGQDAAGKGIYSALTTLVPLISGGLALGIPATSLVRREKQRVHFCIRGAAWLILLSPILLVGAVILWVFIGDSFGGWFREIISA